jgi:acyl-CoA dehydrogenase
VSGLKNVEYAALAEITGWASHIAPEAINCDAPNTGNMEVLHMFGTAEQKSQWLHPLMEGEIRSAFAMTEPDVASSDATNISTRIERDGDDYVINGRKWWTSADQRPPLQDHDLMGKTDTDESVHRQQSMILVPTDTPGSRSLRRCPSSATRTSTAQARLRFTDVAGAGHEPHRQRGRRLHDRPGAASGPAHPPLHAGASALPSARSSSCASGRLPWRSAGDRQQGVVREQIAESRMEIDQARLMVSRPPTSSTRSAPRAPAPRSPPSRSSRPRVALNVVDRAIQVHGGGGVSDDFPLARMYAGLRTLRIADGPDEVHVRTVARQELGKYVQQSQSDGRSPRCAGVRGRPRAAARGWAAPTRASWRLGGALRPAASVRGGLSGGAGGRAASRGPAPRPAGRQPASARRAG